MRHPLFRLLGIHHMSSSRLARRRSSRKSAPIVEGLEIRQLLAANVRMVKDINLGDAASAPEFLTDVDGLLYFVAQSPQGKELWKSDGSFDGTVLVKDILPGAAGSSPRELTSVNGILYFSARDAETSGFEVWKSDGTESGTVMVRDIRPGSQGSQPGELTDVGGILYFSASDGTSGQELWKSDGTAAGTVMVADILPGVGSSNPKHLTNIGGTLFFASNNGVHGTELWKSDGTAAGTVMVQDSVAGSKGANPAYLTEMNGSVFYTSFFNATQGLWKSDGTDSGTIPLSVFPQNLPYFDLPDRLTNVNGTLFFSAATAATSRELWKSNGTAAGTQLVKDIRPGDSSSFPDFLTNYNGTLIFKALTTITPQGLWKSNGTSPGTVSVRDINPNANSITSPFVVHDGLVYFGANDGTTGAELWSSDGTFAGTVLEYEFITQPRDAGGGPGKFLSVDGTLYFEAHTPAFHRELWALNTLESPEVIEPATFTETARPTIVWTAVPGAVSYEIVVTDLTSGFSQFIRETVSGTSFTPAVDFGLGRFRVSIRATDAGGQKSGWSAPYEFRNYLRVELQPIVRFQATSRPTITWNALQGAARYDLWIDNITTGQSQVIRNTNVMATSFTPSSDLPMGVYRAWVRGITNDGVTGYFSSAIEFVVVPAPTVNGPLNSTFSRQPTFSWNAVSGAVSYEVVLRNANTGQTVHNVTNILVTQWTPSADLPVGPYRWWVSAVSSDGYRSAAPQVIDFFVGGRTDVLSPTGAANDRTPTFTWRPVDGAASFRVQVDRIDVATVGVINVTSLIATTQYTPTTPLPTGNYRVWVRAIGTFGELAPWSLPVDFQITQSSDPSDDSLLVVLPMGEILAVLHGRIQEWLPASSSTQTSNDAPLDESVDAIRPTEGLRISRREESSPSTGLRHQAMPADDDRDGFLDRLMASQSEADDLMWMF